jgi:uncharacterized protein (DUF2141 family)
MRKTAFLFILGLSAAMRTAQAQDPAGAPVTAQAQAAVPPAAASASASAAAGTRCIDVEVQNVRPLQGWLMLAAYGSAEAYGKQPMANGRVPAGEATTRLSLCGISGDVLAITLFQDLDGDGKMGRNLFGLPLEPWGSSGKPGPYGPSWETGKVTLDGSPVTVRLSS